MPPTDSLSLNYVTSYGETGGYAVGNLYKPTGIAVDNDGNVFVVEETDILSDIGSNAIW